MFNTAVVAPQARVFKASLAAGTYDIKVTASSRAKDAFTAHGSLVAPYRFECTAGMTHTIAVIGSVANRSAATWDACKDKGGRGALLWNQF